MVICLSSGTDQYSEPVHDSMYFDMWINNPHCNNEFPEYTYEEHFGKILPAYVLRAVVRHYLDGEAHYVVYTNLVVLFHHTLYQKSTKYMRVVEKSSERERNR